MFWNIVDSRRQTADPKFSMRMVWSFIDACRPPYSVRLHVGYNRPYICALSAIVHANRWQLIWIHLRSPETEDSPSPLSFWVWRNGDTTVVYRFSCMYVCLHIGPLEPNALCSNLTPTTCAGWHKCSSTHLLRIAVVIYLYCRKSCETVYTGPDAWVQVDFSGNHAASLSALY